MVRRTYTIKKSQILGVDATSGDVTYTQEIEEGEELAEPISVECVITRQQMAGVTHPAGLSLASVRAKYIADRLVNAGFNMDEMYSESRDPNTVSITYRQEREPAPMECEFASEPDPATGPVHASEKTAVAILPIPTCSNCLFYDQDGESESESETEDGSLTILESECRFDSPGSVVVENVVYTTVPLVESDRWCGKWEPVADNVNSPAHEVVREIRSILMGFPEWEHYKKIESAVRIADEILDE